MLVDVVSDVTTEVGGANGPEDGNIGFYDFFLFYYIG